MARLLPLTGRTSFRFRDSPASCRWACGTRSRDCSQPGEEEAVSPPHVLFGIEDRRAKNQNNRCLAAESRSESQDYGGSDYLLRQRRVAHPEAGADVLGDQLNGGTVGERVGLGQILHGLDQQALAFYIARVGSAFASFPVDVGWNRDSKNLGHEVTRFASTKLRVQVLGELSTGLGSSISPHVLIFSSYSQWKILALRRHGFGLAGCLQFENIIGKFLIQLDI